MDALPAVLRLCCVDALTPCCSSDPMVSGESTTSIRMERALHLSNPWFEPRMGSVRVSRCVPCLQALQTDSARSSPAIVGMGQAHGINERPSAARWLVYDLQCAHMLGNVLLFSCLRQLPTSASALTSSVYLIHSGSTLPRSLFWNMVNPPTCIDQGSFNRLCRWHQHA